MYATPSFSSEIFDNFYIFLFLDVKHQSKNSAKITEQNLNTWRVFWDQMVVFCICFWHFFSSLKPGQDLILTLYLKVCIIEMHLQFICTRHRLEFMCTLITINFFSYFTLIFSVHCLLCRCLFIRRHNDHWRRREDELFSTVYIKNFN